MENNSNTNFTGFDEVGANSEPSSDDKKPIYHKLWFQLAVGGFVILLILFILWQTNVLKIGPAGLTIYIEYDDVQALNVGAEVYHEGFVVGEVVEKSLTSDSDLKRVKVRIEEDYWDFITEGSVFRQFENPDSEGGSVRAIEIKEYVATYPPLEKDKVYIGADDSAEEYIQAGKLIGTDWVDKYLSLGEIRVTTVLSGDQVNRVILLETGTLIPQELLFSSALPDDPAWQRLEETTERRHLITIEGTFTQPADASWGNSTVNLREDSKLFFTDYYFSESFSPDQFMSLVDIEVTDNVALIADIVKCVSNPQECLSTLRGCLSDIPACIEQFSGLVKPILNGVQRLLISTDVYPLKNIPIQLSLTMPGRIIETNAQAKQGDTVVWTLNGEILNNGIDLTATSRQYKLVPVLVVVIFVFALLVVGIILVLRKVKRKTVPETQEDNRVVF
jgi:hypothetical protein